MYGKAAWTALALTISNFGYEALTSSNWDVASERSFFQILAILLFVTALMMSKKSRA
jgi:hypothetical protein